MQATDNDKSFVDLSSLNESSSNLLSNAPPVINHSVIISRKFRKALQFDLPSRATSTQIDAIIRRLKTQTLTDMQDDSSITEITEVLGYNKIDNAIDELITIRVYIISFPITIFEQLKKYNIKKCKIYIGHTEIQSEIKIVIGRILPSDFCTVDRDGNTCPYESNLIYTIE